MTTLSGPVTGTAPAVVSRKLLGPRLAEYRLRSPVLGAHTPVRILFPLEYGKDTEARFPVLYLLHGGDDDYRSWTDKGGATEATAELPLIVVMPEASNGFYSDWVKPGRHGRTRWESYHIGELLPWIDRTFRTTGSRGGRALAGLSMGGFGAMSYAARHPDLFCAAASFSGALDTNRHTWVTGVAARRDGGHFDSIWGSRLTNETQWRAHNPWDLAENLRGMSLVLRTGNGLPGPLDEHPLPNPVEAIVYHESLRMHRRLDELGIEHEWHHGPGTHNWPYWLRDLRNTLPVLMRAFADPPAQPKPFSHTSAEDEYTAGDWTVRLSRSEAAFCTLSEVDETGFVLTGGGDADVRTAAWFTPGRSYRVALDGEHDRRVLTAVADPDGRLELKLRLGPEAEGPHAVAVTIGEEHP
ncbi:alpha/beta hydrolase [Amycolatopsis nigrescens]|uniref:alpha/beta hydrolase n=1 Tax=Amycolatopsis nigrescens TaxID=381445 RepID=UPI00036D58F1|nr:alpha/beta hydrolase family protein [Amycolatopsis nigrescens]